MRGERRGEREEGRWKTEYLERPPSPATRMGKRKNKAGGSPGVRDAARSTAACRWARGSPAVGRLPRDGTHRKSFSLRLAVLRPSRGVGSKRRESEITDKWGSGEIGT